MKSGSDFQTSIENIDIGGPAMLRSGAKNHNYVAVLSRPSQYEGFMGRWCTGMPRRKQYPFTTLTDRRAWAVEAFTLSAQYDKTISTYLKLQHQQRLAIRQSMITESATIAACPSNATVHNTSCMSCLCQPHVANLYRPLHLSTLFVSILKN